MKERIAFALALVVVGIVLAYAVLVDETSCEAAVTHDLGAGP